MIVNLKTINKFKATTFTKCWTRTSFEGFESKSTVSKPNKNMKTAVTKLNMINIWFRWYDVQTKWQSKFMNVCSLFKTGILYLAARGSKKINDFIYQGIYSFLDILIHWELLHIAITTEIWTLSKKLYWEVKPYTVPLICSFLSGLNFTSTS